MPIHKYVSPAMYQADKDGKPVPEHQEDPRRGIIRLRQAWLLGSTGIIEVL
jgi:hypothetical protein